MSISSKGSWNGLSCITGIFCLSSLVNTEAKKEFKISALPLPSLIISPFLEIKSGRPSLTLVLSLTIFQKHLEFCF